MYVYMFIFTYSISTVGVTILHFLFIASIDLPAPRDVSILNGRSLSCLYIYILDIVIFRPHKLCSQVVVRGNVSGHR